MLGRTGHASATGPSEAGRADATHLRETVVDGGYCIGCGACAALEGSGIRIAADPVGRLQALIEPGVGADAPVARVCPFSDAAADEDDIAAERFPDLPHHAEIGRHRATYAGWVQQGAQRMEGSSGGLTSWTLGRLLDEGLVDAVLHVQPEGRDAHDDTAPLFRYGISDDRAGLSRGAKSRYYPVELSEALRRVRERPGRYAVVGVPCFLRAVALLRREDAVLRERITLTVALVCGHLKSSAFADSIAWQTGVHPADVAAIDFRHKLPDRPANKYAAEIVELGADPVVTPMDELLGHNWGHGFFKYQACDFCDDVLGETADVTFGDAWLPGYRDDWRGTNVVVVRDAAVAELLERGRDAGELQLDDLAPERVAESQRAGLRHRRDGLAYRLHLADRRREWRPPKRVRPAARALSRRDRQVFRLRERLAARSHTAFAEARARDDLQLFRDTMAPLVAEYQALYAPPRTLRVRLGALRRRVLDRLRG